MRLVLVASQSLEAASVKIWFRFEALKLYGHKKALETAEYHWIAKLTAQIYSNELNLKDILESQSSSAHTHTYTQKATVYWSTMGWDGDQSGGVLRVRVYLSPSSVVFRFWLPLATTF